MTMRIFIPITFLVIASLLFLPAAESQMVQVIVGGKRATASCAGNSTKCDDGSNEDSNGSENWVYVASQFTAGESATICSIELRLIRSGTPGGVYKIGIFSDTGSNVPSALQGSWSDNYNINDTTTSAAWYTATKSGGLGVSITSGTKYWIVLYSSSATYQTNFYAPLDTSCYIVPHTRSDNASTWSSSSNVRGFSFRLHK
jgi:hypothetical protein